MDTAADRLTSLMETAEGRTGAAFRAGRETDGAATGPYASQAQNVCAIVSPLYGNVTCLYCETPMA